jgi:integrase/recombinase XerD
LPVLNLALWQARFGEHLELRRFSPRTVASYGAELRPFFEFLEEQGVDQLTAVTRETLQSYQVHLHGLRQPNGKPLTVSTQSCKLTAILGFFRFLYRERFLVLDPGRDLALPKLPPPLPPAVLSEAEVTRLLEAPDADTATGLRDRAILEVLYSSALRNSEMGALILDELDLARGQLRVINGKGGRHRVVPLGEPACEALQAYLRQGRPQLLRQAQEPLVFLSSRGRAMSREALAEVVHRAAHQAGLEKRVTPHLLRHCCACHMLAHRASLRHIQELLGMLT